MLIAWPHADTDWAERLAEVETTYVALAAAVTRFQPLIIVVADNELRIRVQSLLPGEGVDLSQIRFVEQPYDDTWLRDSGPITLTDGADFRSARFPLHRLGRQIRSRSRRSPDRDAGRTWPVFARAHASASTGRSKAARSNPTARARS